jgi:hypothetical protein
MSIGKYAQSLILNNLEMSNTQILEEVKKMYPSAKTSMACIAWYKSDLRKKNLLAKKNQPVELVDDKQLDLFEQTEE